MNTEQAEAVWRLSDVQLAELIGKATTLTLDDRIYDYFIGLVPHAIGSADVTREDHEFGMRVATLALAKAWTDLALLFMRKMRPDWRLDALTKDDLGWSAKMSFSRDLTMASMPGVHHSQNAHVNESAYVGGLAIMAAFFRLLQIERR